MSETVWLRSDEWVGAEVEDSFVMVSIETGKYVALNKTADAVWRALETPCSASKICDILIERFEVEPEQCARAVATTLATMRTMELAKPQ